MTTVQQLVENGWGRRIVAGKLSTILNRWRIRCKEAPHSGVKQQALRCSGFTLLSQLFFLFGIPPADFSSDRYQTSWRICRSWLPGVWSDLAWDSYQGDDPYLKVRFKFDEKTMRKLNPLADRNSPPPSRQNPASLEKILSSLLNP